MPPRSDFIKPCLPSTADQPPSGPEWIHEIKHDGYRLMARRDPIGIRLLTRRGNDWSERFPRVVEAVNLLKVRSCLIDGEVVCCDERGVAAFHVPRRRRNEPEAFLYAKAVPPSAPEGYSGSPAFRRPSAYLVTSSGRRRSIKSLRSDTRTVGSISRKRAMAFCASSSRPASALLAAKTRNAG
jgi:hypothetical protein